MPVEVHTPPEGTTFTSLIKGIVNDVGDLIQQEFRFARKELRADLRRTAGATLSLAIGVGMASLGLVLLLLMLVHLLNWLTLPPGFDRAGLPLWSCYAIVGGLLAGGGAVLAYVGKKKFDSFNPLPDETVQTIKENLEWTKNSK